MSRAGIIRVSDHGGWAVLVTADGNGTLLDGVAMAVPGRTLGLAVRQCPELPPTIAERITNYAPGMSPTGNVPQGARRRSRSVRVGPFIGTTSRAIRSDNGVPFASPNGLFNLSKLSVWWLRLGISIERISAWSSPTKQPP